MKIYIDGSLESLTTVKDTLNKTIQTSVDFVIGSRTGGNYFSGQIDDVRVYYNVLTQGEITWLNNSGNGQSLKTLNISTDNYVNTEYYIEIPHVGRVYDADLTLKVESVSTPIGSGNITIELVKEEINDKIADVDLIDYFSEFANPTAFSFARSLDLADYLNNDSIYQFYGKYVLTIKVYGTYLFDQFTVLNFSIETDTFVQASAEDTEGWITNPAKKDTDDDGWNDYKEIFGENTNPLQVDTDGDSAWDPFDRDPHKDVMLEICPVYGQSIWSFTQLQIVTMFTKGDTNQQFYLPSVYKTPDVFEDPLWTAYFDGTHGSSLDLHYYVDINDNLKLQKNTIQFKTQLWWVNRYFGIMKLWDELLASGANTYTIGEVGHSETLTINYNNNFKAAIQVKTIGIEKANTIAIYETNGTVFNGHYQEQERMNIIQLYINDSGTGTPFEAGLNTIVIPTSLFTETVFNAHVQNETLSATPIYSSDEEKFKFISVGREGNTKQACDEIDFVIIRFDISSEDAMEILDLLLTCRVNQTNNQTCVVYSYISTKLNGTSAIMMNLPISVLQYIPWYCDFSDSPKGPKPQTFADWFWAPLIALAKAIIGVIFFIVMAIVLLVILIIKFFIDIFMEVLPILQYILWLIIRVLLLVLIWVMFALALLVVITFFVLIIGLVFILNLFMNFETTLSWNNITTDGDIDLSFKYIIGIEYFGFLCFYIPTIAVYFGSSLFQIEYSSSSFSEELKVTEYPQNLFYNFTQNTLKQSSNNNPKPSSTSTDELIVEAIIHFGIGMAIGGGFTAVYAGFYAFSKNSPWEKFGTLIMLGMFIASIILLIILMYNTDNTKSLGAKFFGLGIGLIFAGTILYLLSNYITNTWAYMDDVVNIICFGSYKLASIFYIFVGALDILFGALGIFFDIADVLKWNWGDNIPGWKGAMMAITLIAGFIALAGAALALLILGGHYHKKDGSMGNNKMKITKITKSDKAFVLGFGCILFGVLLIGIGIPLLVLDEEPI